MYRLKVVGPFHGLSGYDHHTRQLVRGLASLDVAIELVQHEGWSTPMAPDARDPWFDSLNQPAGADTVLHFVMPPRLALEPGLRNVNYTMFEADRVPAPWVDWARACDLTVLTTEAARQAWIESGTPADRLRVSPLGVDGAAFTGPAEPLPMVVNGRPITDFGTRLLHVAELRPRKNHLGLLEAWLRATKADDDAVLILKTTIFAPRVWPMFEADIAELQQRLGRNLTEAAPIVLINTPLSGPDMRALYASATHYISMSCGEGWDLPMMEAGAAGLDLIAPRHTAYPSYLAEDAAHWIPAPLVPAEFKSRLGPEDRVFFDGLNWWEPDVEVAAAIIRTIVAKASPRPRSPQARIVEEFSWREAARRLLDVLTE